MGTLLKETCIPDLLKVHLQLKTLFVCSVP